MRLAFTSLMAYSLACLLAAAGPSSLATGQDRGELVELSQVSTPRAALESESTSQHSLWEINSRNSATDVRNAACSDSLPVARCNAGHWQNSAHLELLADIAANPARTIIYVHGNRTDWADARVRAGVVYQLLVSRADGPIRVISLNWPSERPPAVLPKQLVSQKQSTITATSFHLANFLRRLPSDEVRGIIGFSFGCSVISGALHLLAGGSLDGCQLAAALRPPSAVRLGFVVPAFDCNAYCSGGRYEAAPVAIEYLVNLYNSQDPILKHFRLFDQVHPVAAGYAGLKGLDGRCQESCHWLQVDCRAIGKTHAEKDYRRCPNYRVLIDNVLGKQLQHDIGD
ncbi:MAG: hypothetical protein KF752_00155 [Pirellulaceae bacterium]|nr:hypothetical protein [Pirellulaceae bacterium]